MVKTSSKILIISPTPTHITNAGNRRHILNVVEELNALGYEIFYFYINREVADLNKMKDYFKSNLYVYNEPQKLSLIYRVQLKLNRFFNKNFLSRKQSFEEQVYNQHIDHHFPYGIESMINDIIKRKNIDTIIVEYVFISRILRFLPKQINKIIDTHDKFTNRFNLYLDRGEQPSWVSLELRDEIKGLNRADSIICLNSDELTFFKKNGYKGKSILFSNLQLIKNLYEVGDSNKLLYLASANDLNIKSINDFIKDCFSPLLLNKTNFELIIGGEISNYIEFKHERITTLGFVDSLDMFYSLGKIVINPEIRGTGQKIKSIEALRYNKILVSTTPIGLLNFEDFSFFARDYIEMSEELIRLNNNISIAENKIALLNQYRAQSKSELQLILSKNQST